MNLYDNRGLGARMCCFACGNKVLVAVEMRHNAHREDQAAFDAYLCLDCIKGASGVAGECEGDPEDDTDVIGDPE